MYKFFTNKNFSEVDINYYRQVCNRDECDHDYGRCTTLEDIEVKSTPNSWEVAKSCGFRDELTTYCVDRLLMLAGISDKDNYNLEICSGYYGEEIDRITFINGSLLDKKIEELLKLDDNQKIHYTLKEEYSLVLPELMDKNFQVTTINNKDIILGQLDYSKKLSKKLISYYRGYTLPVGIIINGRLIDGYHRFAANTSKIVKVIQAC